VTVSLVVSVGALPAIQGMSFDDAKLALEAAGLDVASGPQEDYNDTIPVGQVIGLVETGVIQPGDDVTVDVSKGPPPVQIPDIVNKTWAEARDMLAAAGLNYEFRNNRSRDIANTFPNSSTVTAVEPGVGETVLKGSTVKVGLAVSG
jgi:serine/threonine-protein kinase